MDYARVMDYAERGEKRHKELSHLLPSEVSAVCLKELFQRNALNVFKDNVAGIVLAEHILRGAYAFNVPHAGEGAVHIHELRHIRFVFSEAVGIYNYIIAVPKNLKVVKLNLSIFSAHQ